MFVNILILNHFDLKYHIHIEIDASGYTIGGIFSQLILNDLGQWYLVVIFSQKIIFAKTQYKTNDGELLAIIEIFKT